MFGMGPTEMIVIGMMVIVLFGAKRLPELARSVGRSIKEFKHATQDLRDEFDLELEDRPRATRQRRDNADTQSDSAKADG